MLIGKGGEAVRSLERDTGARIEVSREEEKETERRVTVNGASEAVRLAVEAIKEIMNRAQSRETGGSTAPSTGGDCRKVLQISQAFIGMIIGKGGEKIKAMSRDSGARIEVSRDDGGEDRIVTVTGTPEGIEKALVAIEEVIRQAHAAFGPMGDSASGSDTDDALPPPPPGFEACEREGWLHNARKDAYYERRSGRLFWLDPLSNLFKELHHGLALDLRFMGAAALGTGSALSSGAAPAPKHVVIPDLHRVGQALNLRLEHLERPCAMLGVFGCVDGMPVDTVARGLHEKLVRRLAASRSEWPDDLLFGALTGALFDVGGAHGNISPVAALALTIGRRVLAVASPGTSVCLMTGASASLAVPAESVAAAGATTCFEEVAQEPSASVCIALAAGNTLLDEGETAIAVVPHLYQSRPRAASAALLRAARQRGANGPLATACARLWVPPAPVATAVTASGSANTSAEVRRPIISTAAGAGKAEAPAVPKQVRVRQILIRHWRGSGAKPVNPVLRKPVSRSPEEAEALLLVVLEKLVPEDDRERSPLNLRFSTACKESSECQSALKGGEFAGDLGWLDQAKDAALKKAKGEPEGPKSVVKPTVPAPVLKAAFELEIGELSDTLSSELGVHILLRIA